MPLPEKFDVNTFDAVDLWHITEKLARLLPGLHIARIFEPVFSERGTSGTTFLKVLLAAPEIQDVEVGFQEAIFKGSITETYDRHYRIRQSMGEASIFEEVTRDMDSQNADRGAQQELLDELLPKVVGMSITPNVTDRINRATTLTRRQEGLDRGYIQSVAQFNLQLAELVGEELAPYEEIVTRAETWEAAKSIPASLPWLTPGK